MICQLSSDIILSDTSDDDDDDDDDMTITDKKDVVLDIMSQTSLAVKETSKLRPVFEAAQATQDETTVLHEPEINTVNTDNNNDDDVGTKR